MKKKWMLILSAALIVSTMAACGNKTGESSKGGSSKALSNDNITISQYKGVEVQKIEAEKVTDEIVEKEIQSILYENRVMNEVTDRPAQTGDIVALDYTGLSDGEKFDEGTLEVEIGSGRMIEGFEEGLVGHKAGESFDLNLTFPENYMVNPDLSGAPAVFQIKVNKVTQQTIPELNDEFVKKVSEEAATVEEYKEQVKKELKELSEKSARNMFKSAAWETILKNVKVTKYPEGAVDEQKELIVSQYKSLAESNEMEFADFLEKMMNGMTEEDFMKEAEKVAKEIVKQDLVAELITEKEKLEVSGEELEKTMEEYKTKYGFKSVDAMKEAIGEKYLLKDIQLSKVKDWAAENCKIVEAKEEK